MAIGYPLWPLAALVLLVAGPTPYVRRQAIQSIAFHFSIYLAWIVLIVIAHIPVLGWGAWPLVILIEPVAIVVSIIYGLAAWRGEDVRIPGISAWLDAYEKSA